ncbi:hypothetical protein V9T40_006011 [Parthenolecanium corni]|uniref:MULE transposase domain-containing protein n=1 Tax=Parthenolecanium corni TaxID=536013 RepID=A0AAN9TXJ4_9HEMI
MTDFEKAIINACQGVYPDVSVSCCFFHLGQSVNRHVQQEDLQIAYNDPVDRSINVFTHMILSLAYVPVAHTPSLHLPQTRSSSYSSTNPPLL